VDTRTFVFKESARAKTRPPYPPEFRRQPEELAQEEPTAQSIRNWVGRAECDAGRRSDGLTTAEREESRSKVQRTIGRLKRASDAQALS